eukprot:TRINITY_DN4690_c0_g1_i2.p2 TRINITY_DN4690_c0_g1~~TRINITY_DN4690_c0_g1_i2.p2  ORF type:complete len:361 (-),score=95.91 TRINITY_DN4690_c0_g1_i2:1324-2406(-)
MDPLFLDDNHDVPSRKRRNGMSISIHVDEEAQYYYVPDTDSEKTVTSGPPRNPPPSAPPPLPAGPPPTRPSGPPSLPPAPPPSITRNSSENFTDEHIEDNQSIEDDETEGHQPVEDRPVETGAIEDDGYIENNETTIDEPIEDDSFDSESREDYSSDETTSDASTEFGIDANNLPPISKEDSGYITKSYSTSTVSPDPLTLMDDYENIAPTKKSDNDNRKLFRASVSINNPISSMYNDVDDSNWIKLCMLGGNVGKSSSLVRYMGENEEPQPTQSTIKHHVIISGDNVSIFDTPGDISLIDERMKNCILQSDGFFFFFSLESKDSLDMIRGYHELVMTVKKYYSISFPCFLVGTHSLFVS